MALIDCPECGAIEEYCYKEYFQQGFQVVYAVHWDNNKSLHVHFVINTINFKDGKKWHR